MEEILRPNYYKGKTLEAIDVIEDFDCTYNVGVAIAYQLRAGKKEGNERKQDLMKAMRHLNREITGKWD